MKKFISIILAILITCSVMPVAFAAYEYENPADPYDSGVMVPSKPVVGSFRYEIKSGYVDGRRTEYLSFLGLTQDQLSYQGPITIPEKVTINTYDVRGEFTVREIEQGALYGYFFITEINIPDTIQKIGDLAFVDTAIKTFNIPEKVESIGEGIFFGCQDLNNIYVDDDNANYLDRNGVCYSKSGELYAFPANRTGSYEVHSSTTKIAKCAFGYSDITSVTIPAGVKEIGRSAFFNSDLTEIHFGGSKEQWDKVSIDAFNGPVGTSTKYFAAGSVTSTEKCSCKCHANFFTAVFFRIFNAFAMLFGGGQRTCACGVAH